MIFQAISEGTIFAPATAKGKSAVAIIRISGKHTLEILTNISGVNLRPREMVLRRIIHPKNREVLDEALVVYFPKGRSYTGEDSAELHLHGSRATLKAVMSCLLDEGLRMAEPGEFTYRALLNGQMDLAQIEGLGDLIEAETETQRKQAQRALDGEISHSTISWKNELIHCLALLETEIEFSEEEIPEDIKNQTISTLLGLRDTLLNEVKGVDMAERLRDGFEVAIIGPPNSGKSTLLNYLAGREAAITSNYAGTTRDVLEVYMEVEGLPVCFLDTAGIRESSDPIEKIGIEKTKKRAKDADLRIFLQEPNLATFPGVEWQEGDLKLMAKVDLVKENDLKGVSGLTGQGVNHMLEDIARELENRIEKVGVMNNTRQRQAIERAITYLVKAELELAGTNGRSEIAAEELRQAIRALETITGAIDIEQVLGEIFSNFCIGK